jgi:sodium transport system permease protein
MNNLQSQSAWPDSSSRIPPLHEAFLVLSIAMGLVILFSSAVKKLGTDNLYLLLGSRFNIVLLFELTSLGLPLALFLLWKKYDLRVCLGLAFSGKVKIFGGALLGISTVILAPQFEALQARLIPIDSELLESYSRFVTVLPGESLFWAFCCVALIPSLAEEAFFRGFLLRSALERWPRTWAIAGIGILFGLFHLNLWHLPALTLIGMLLTWVAIRTSSVWPAVAFHFTNNGLALSLVNWPGSANEGWVKGVGDVPESIFIAGLTLFSAGVLLSAWPKKNQKNETNID